MDKSTQSGFQGNDTGDTDAKLVESHPDNEDGHNNYTNRDNPTNDKQPHPGTEVPDEHDEEPHSVREAQHGIKNVPNSDDDTHKIKAPHLDAEAGPHFDTEVHCDRGWAWVVCGTTFLMEFFVGGLITSSGVIYAALVDEFNKSRAETGNCNRFTIHCQNSLLKKSNFYNFHCLC